MAHHIYAANAATYQVLHSRKNKRVSATFLRLSVFFKAFGVVVCLTNGNVGRSGRLCMPSARE